MDIRLRLNSNGTLTPIAANPFGYEDNMLIVTDLPSGHNPHHLAVTLKSYAAIPISGIGGSFTISWSAIQQAMQPGQPRALAVLVST